MMAPALVALLAAPLAAPAPGEPRGMQPADFDLQWELPPPVAAVKTPIPAFCDVDVEGTVVPTETDYLPHVIQCENGGANLEALKAQAIAARSVVYYNMANDGTICDGQGCQVYSCGADPSPEHYQAVEETAGQYLSYNGWLTYAFFVAGDSNTAPPGCIDTDNGTVSATEKYVTFNEGKTLYDVEQTDLGFVFPDDVNVAGYGQNRGCMGQWGARCLENNNGYDVTEILRFYYGADIEILQAEGPCVVPPNQPPSGAFDAAGCDLVRGWAFDPETGAGPIDVHVSFGGPYGDPNAVSATVAANLPRPDLCDLLGSCDHGFELAPPRSLLDGLPHPVHVVAVDPQSGPLEIGALDLDCPPPALPGGVRRHIIDPASLTAWQFDPFWQGATLDDAALTAIPEWKALPADPLLVRLEGAPEVWLIDTAFKRRIAPEVAAAWKFDLAAAIVWEPAQLDVLPEGTPVRAAPFLVRGSGPALYVLDDPQCPPDGDPQDPQCPVGATTDGESATSDGEPDPSGGSSGEPEPTGGPATTSGSDESGGALPPGYGQDGDAGCGCRGAGARPGLLALVLLALRRRRRGSRT